MILAHLKFGACISLRNTKYCLKLLSLYIHKNKTWESLQLKAKFKKNIEKIQRNDTNEATHNISCDTGAMMEKRNARIMQSQKARRNFKNP